MTALLHHVGLTVPDLGSAVRFLTEALGCEHLFTTPAGTAMTAEDARRLNLAGGETIRGIAMLRAGNVHIELFDYGAPGQSRDFPKNSDVGGSHLAFAVPDIEAVRPRIEASGGRLMPGPNRATSPGFEGLVWVYLVTPWGQTLELVETKDAVRLKLDPARYGDAG